MNITQSKILEAIANSYAKNLLVFMKKHGEKEKTADGMFFTREEIEKFLEIGSTPYKKAKDAIRRLRK